MSLKSKIISLVLVIATVLGILSFTVVTRISNKVGELELSSYESYAKNLSNGIADQFYERYGDVQTFAMNPDLQAPSRKVIVDTLNRYSAMYGIYDLIMVVNSKGHLVAVNDKSPDGKDLDVKSLYEENYAEAPWFKSTLEGKTLEDPAKGFSGTYFEDAHVDPYTSKIYGQKRLGTSFSAAIKDRNGTTIGIVTNRASPRWFEGPVKNMYATMKSMGLNTSDIVLTDKTGLLFLMYESDPKSQKLDDVKYEWDEVLKYNFVTDHFEGAVRLTKEAAGSGIYMDPREKEPHVTGFSRVTGPKFPDSIGWGVMVRNSAKDAEGTGEVKMLQKVFYVTFSVVMVIALFVAWLIASRIANSVIRLAERLSQGSIEVTGAANDISGSSQRLSESVTEQAAAIQETAASLEEMTSMIRSSTSNAERSKELSSTSRAFSEQGKNSIDQMITAIKEINASNDTIMKQVDQGNAQISEIVKMIQEIGQKTKVINDIVFQTKLLSFNASVEAARAGEHGKGFAVVAEEVGNLAQMSGNAAKEIGTLLESSTKRVEKIVNETKSNVGREAQNGKAKVDAGTQIAMTCADLLEKILHSSQEVDQMVSQISSAAREQSQGVGEITKAMNQLDQVTGQNSGIAQKSASASVQLKKEAEALGKMVSELLLSVNGTAVSSEPSAASPKKDETITARVSAKISEKIEKKLNQKKPAETKTTKVAKEPVVASKPAAAKAAPEVKKEPKVTIDQDLGVPKSDDPRFEDL